MIDLVFDLVRSRRESFSGWHSQGLITVGVDWDKNPNLRRA